MKLTLTVVVAATIVTACLFVALAPEPTNSSEGVATIRSEWFDKGQVWQLLEKSDRRIVKRRFGLTDEVWIYTPPQKLRTYRLVRDEDTVMMQDDTTGDGKIDRVLLHLADGRRCWISNLAEGRETATVRFEK